MRDAVVRLKSGAVLCGPLWMWRPAEGWFSLACEDDSAKRVQLDDVLSAEIENEWINYKTIGTVDLLERARSQGWIPSSK